MHRQVPTVPDGCQVGLAGAEPTTPVDVAVELREALLAVAVDVVGQGVPGLLDGLEEGAEQRRRGGPALQDQGSRAAAPGVGACQAGLHALEVREAVRVVPLLEAGVAGPALVVERVAALEDHAVDGRRAAEHLAAGVEDPSSTHVRLGLGLVAPVVEAAADGEGQRGGHVDERVELGVGAPCLEHQDARPGIRAQTVGEGGPGGPAADDHVVVALHANLRQSRGAGSAPNQPLGAGRVLCQTCLDSRYSSSPASPSSRPTPLCLKPPHSAWGTYGW